MPFSYLSSICKLIRVKQWIKNVFCLCPVFFSKHFFELHSLYSSFLCFAAFCFASSAIYCLNDITDKEYDKISSSKKDRPIASGVISVKAGYLVMLCCLFIASLITYYISYLPLFLIILIYLMLNTLYCLKLKKYAIVDVVIVSLGFVLRVLAGGLSCNIWISHWLILLSFLLALLLSLGKRRGEYVNYKESGNIIRESLENYSISFFNFAMTIVATVAIVCYILYTLSPEVVLRFESDYVYTTSFFVIIGMLRYIQIIVSECQDADPINILYYDRFICLCIMGWMVSFFIIIYV